MKRVLYSVCIGSLALALTAGAAQDKRSERARPQHRTANVHAARPANTGATMSAHRNVSAAQYRQRSYAKPRTSSNAVVKHNTGLRAVRERNLARNEALRERNRTQEFRARNNVAVNRDRNLAVTRTRNDVNRYRNTNDVRETSRSTEHGMPRLIAPATRMSFAVAITWRSIGIETSRSTGQVTPPIIVEAM